MQVTVQRGRCIAWSAVLSNTGDWWRVVHLCHMRGCFLSAPKCGVFPPPSYLRSCAKKEVTACLLCHFVIWNELTRPRTIHLFFNPLWQHPGDSAVQLSQWAVCANPGLPGSEIRVCDSEFMCLGHFAAEHYAVCIQQNWKNKSV